MAFSSGILLSLLALLSYSQIVLAVPTSSTKRQAMNTVPTYVLDYAPVVWLHSNETYMPSDIGAQLVHTRPEVNFTPVQGAPSQLTLDNLDSLNALGGKSIYLTSLDDVSQKPAWLNGVKPDSTGKTNGAASTAVIVNDHGAGNVDAFYMYFYAFNGGPFVIDQIVGNHVGDWEHTMVRFANGVPQAVWFSQHSFGEAFTYDAVEKQGKRPVSYSAIGSHANYAISGPHDHTIPGLNLFVGPLQDYCDQGTLWDPVLSAYFYKYDVNVNSYTAYDPGYPTAWLQFLGQWGDQQYPNSDHRQQEIFGIPQTAKYVGGPTGPEDKQLNRTNICPANSQVECFVSPFLRP